MFHRTAPAPRLPESVADLAKVFGIDARTPARGELRAHDASGAKAHLNCDDKHGLKPSRTLHRGWGHGMARHALDASVQTWVEPLRTDDKTRRSFVDWMLREAGCQAPGTGIRVRQVRQLQAWEENHFKEPLETFTRLQLSVLHSALQGASHALPGPATEPPRPADFESPRRAALAAEDVSTRMHVRAGSPQARSLLKE